MKNDAHGYCMDWLRAVVSEGSDVDPKLRAVDLIAANYFVGQSARINGSQDAIDYLNEAFSVSMKREIGDWALISGYALADAHYAAGSYSEAIGVLDELTVLLREEGLHLNSVNYLYAMEVYANSNFFIKNYEKAVSFYRYVAAKLLMIREDGLRNSLLLSRYAISLEKSGSADAAGDVYYLASVLYPMMQNGVPVSNFRSYLESRGMSESAWKKLRKESAYRKSAN